MSRKGTRFEHAVREDLESRGYFIVRAAGSQGVADLVGLKRGKVPILVQCKNSVRRGLSVVPPGEWNALHDLADKSDALAVIAIRPGRQGIQFWIVTGRKEGRSRNPPAFPFTPGFGDDPNLKGRNT